VSANPLNEILALPPEAQQARGLTDTPHEIAHQPEAWRQTALLVRQAAPQLAQFLAGTDRLVFSGAGTSHYIGLSLAGLFRRGGLHAEAIPSTEIVVDPAEALPPAPFGLVSFARSGNSPEGNQAFRLASRLRPGQKHLVITCNPEGELYRLAGAEPGAVRLLLPALTNDRGLAMTSSFTSMVIAGQGLAAVRAGDLEGYADRVERMATGAERLLAEYPAILAQMAAIRPKRAVFLGTGTLLGAATEAHLKCQEMTAGAVVGKPESYLGLRHGPMAVIDQETLVVAFLSTAPERRRYELDLLREMRAKGLGAAVLAVAADPTGLNGLADQTVLTGAGLPDDLLPPLYVVAAQVLALFLSLGYGLKPDAPSAGVINRVVQGVRIYDAP
jgi:tagatose-6-phosphate ketose/aldose isomerase